MLGKRTSSNTNSEGVAVQMQCWEDGPTATWMQRELQYRCSSDSDRPWVVVQDAVVQRMLGREA